eukprot:CAMPEP_0119412526 /NCGR_PEP_ID=MMETSP1335-20130426/4940_1 /TAXON_ID=259385 /ORGANISM="Chrysoculter rhomboideus, Strain RCC1486" /LENGTH=97 /DNA_ID=CAMNT_0007437275 /DNA_START=116 /DNA_END=409 /DNA_ORIENTATION=-
MHLGQIIHMVCESRLRPCRRRRCRRTSGCTVSAVVILRSLGAELRRSRGTRGQRNEPLPLPMEPPPPRSGAHTAGAVPAAMHLSSTRANRRSQNGSL